MVTALISFVIIVLPFLVFRRKSAYKNLFPLMLIASGIYYCVAGYLYWVTQESGYFVGVDWTSSLPNAALIFSFALFLTTISFYLFLPRSDFVFNQPNRVEAKLDKKFILLSLLAFVSCLFVFASAQSRGAFFLVAYQASDISIALILYAALTQPKSRNVFIFAALFVAYCIFVGFRYKLIILAFPLWILLLCRSKGFLRALVLVGFPVIIIILFAVVTITRVKFSGLEISQLQNVDSTRLLYGFFAETNILFGVISINDFVLPSGNYIYFDPLVDALLELIPRYFIPSRDTGQQIQSVLLGLYSDEGINSGTTYPFFGEYLLMFGYFGYCIGCILCGFFTARLVNYGCRGPSKEATWVACALIAVLFGYYYVSRGYFPQFFKSLIFILFPFLYLTRSLRIDLRKRSG